MAESSQEYTNGSTETELACSDEQSTTATILARIQSLMQQNKIAVFQEVVNLSVQQMQQQTEIIILQRSLKQELEERVLTKRTFTVQHDFKTNIIDIEQQNKSATARLQNKLGCIQAHIKSIDVLRQQLKQDVDRVRFEMDELNYKLNESKDTEQTLFRVLETAPKRLKELEHEYDKAVKEHNQLWNELQVKETEFTNLDSHYTDILQKSKEELLEKEHKLNLLTGQLQEENQKLAQQNEANGQLRSENQKLQHQYDQLTKTIENELLQKKQYLIEQEQDVKKACAEIIAKGEERMQALQHTFDESTKAKNQSQEHLVQLYSRQSEMKSKLQDKENDIKALEVQLLKLKHLDGTDKAAINLVKSSKPNNAPIKHHFAERYVYTSKNAASLQQKKELRPASNLIQMQDSSVNLDQSYDYHGN